MVSSQTKKKVCTIFLILLLNFGNSQNDFFLRHSFKVLPESSFIKVLQVERELDCAFACNHRAECKSFNFAAVKSFVGKFTCQLLTVDMFEKSLTENQKFHHYQIFYLNPCNDSPCLNGGKCTFVQATRDVNCQCTLGFSGPLCQTVHWTKFDYASPLCFGATNDYYANFNIPKTGSLITMRLVHISDELTCDVSNPKGLNHWGCLDANGKYLFMSVIITDNTKAVKLPGSDKFVGMYGKVWNSIGMDARSKELVFPTPSTLLPVVSGEQYQIWFGQDLDNISDSNNGGKVCVDVFGLYK